MPNIRYTLRRSLLGRWILNVGCWVLVFNLIFAIRTDASVTAPVSLFSAAQVDGEGFFLQQIVKAAQPLPALKLGDAPAFGKTIELSRAQINSLIAAVAPDLATTNWTGPESIRISRRARTYGETEMLALLSTTLQNDLVKDKGELELAFQQPWPAQLFPDEPLTLKLLVVPTAGVTPSFIVRFEIHAAHETIGTFQASVQAHVWREVWIAHTSIKRGELTDNADITRERRDVINIREALANYTAEDPSLEFAESVSAGTPLPARVLKPMAVIHRGQTANALVSDGALTITMKVVALEDGAPGQTIHFRNSSSARSLSGKVLNEQTILISL
jgi:flagella basal body P-ring formation protein FlgA